MSKSTRKSGDPGGSEAQVQAGTQGRTSSRAVLLGLIAIFVGPLLLATILYVRLDLWTPSIHVNYGELLLPIRPIESLDIQTIENKTLSLQDLKGRWTYVYLGSGTCGLYCQAELFKVRQARAMLGRDLVRVQYIYLALDDDAKKGMAQLKEGHPQMIVGVTESPEKPTMFGPGSAGYLYLLDPLGNLVLRYGHDAETKGMQKDLKRLLKVSNIG